MTSTTPISVFDQINAVLDQIVQARAEIMAQPLGARRCRQLAELADIEAAWWEEVSEHSQTRVCWRAAQVAREHALHLARHWRAQAATRPAPAPGAPRSPETAGMS